MGVTAEVTPRLFFGRSGTVNTKHLLQMTLQRGVHRFSGRLDFRRIPIAYVISAKIPKMAKKCPKTGPPQKNTIFNLCQVYTPPWCREIAPNAFSLTSASPKGEEKRIWAALSTLRWGVYLAQVKNRVFLGATPFWGTFWPFWAFWLKSRYAIGSLRKSRLLLELHTPLGVTADAARMLFFDRPGTVDTKYSLYMTSAVSVCTVLVAALTSVDFQ